MIIMTSDKEEVIGSIILVDHVQDSGNIESAMGRVMKESTEAAYLAQPGVHLSVFQYFYEVSVD